MDVDHNNEIINRKKDIAKKYAETENYIDAFSEAVQDMKVDLRKDERTQTFSFLIILIGIILVPFFSIIGIVLIIGGIIGVVVTPKDIKEKRNKIIEYQQNINKCRKHLVYLIGEQAALE